MNNKTQRNMLHLYWQLTFQAKIQFHIHWALFDCALNIAPHLCREVVDVFIAIERK